MSKYTEQNGEKIELFKSIKSAGWDAISLSNRGYRGCVKAFKNINEEKVPVMFYLDECFVVEDSLGLFRVEDLKSFFMKEHKEIDLTATGCIEGLSLVAYLDESCQVHFEDSTMTRLGINDNNIRSDIRNRLFLVNQLSEEVEIDMGFGRVDK